jgi:SAM-dependent methyltransferase
VKQTGPAQGQTYTEWYAQVMDRQMQKAPDAFFQPWRVYQLEYLIAHGLTPEMSLLDYGCGPCGAGVFMIEYLEAGKYTGADISEACLAGAEKFLRERGAIEKRPELVLLPGGSLAPLAGTMFDMIWAQSVLTHMPPAELLGFVQDLPRCLRPGVGVLYATFLIGEALRQENPKSFVYTERFVRDACAEAGVRCEILRDYQHPNDPGLADRGYAVLKISA